MSEESTVPEAETSAVVEVAQEQSELEEQDLQRLLDEARKMADEHWNHVLRLQAELENGRRRAARDVENAHKYALERFAIELLPVRDSLELALAAIGADSSLDQLREGTDLTLKMMTQAMEKYGIKEVYPLEQPFNPELHQAMSAQESEDHPPNSVLNVMQKGYTLNERLIRPALVVVSKAPVNT